MFRLILLFTALAGFGAVIMLPDTSPRAMQPADTLTALVYGEPIPVPTITRVERTPFNPAAAFGNFMNENLQLDEIDAANADLLTITTEDGEVIRVAAEVPPARIGATMVRIEANDRHAEAQRLAAANARARLAVAAATRAASGVTVLPADVVYSTGSYVNLRSGPSTGYPAVGFMGYGMAAERLEVLNTGWTHIRIIETGQEGYMSSLYVTARGP